MDGSPQDPSEHVLLERIRGGDPQAFADLLGRHEGAMQARARRMVNRRLQGRYSVSDVLQEARVAAFDGLREFVPVPGGTVQGWLVQVVTRKAIDLARHQGAAKRSPVRELDRDHRPETGALPDSGPTPSEMAVAGELQEAARRVLAELPADYRTVLRLTRQQGLPLHAAAECMGRSPEATKKLYGRALASFGEHFERLTGRRLGS